MNSRKTKSKSCKSNSLPSTGANSESMSSGQSFYVKTSQKMGRYMVSKMDIKPGQIILREDPLVVGPCSGCRVQCIGCYKDVESANGLLNRCNNCGWPLCCSSTCPGLHRPYGHTQAECHILKECHSSSSFDYHDLATIRGNYHAIVPLRCLILKSSDPDTFHILMNMESHNKIRMNIPDIWKDSQVNVVDKILKEWELTEYTEDEIHKICGVLEVNAFEIGQEGIDIRGIYPTAYLMSHDCVPNTNHSDEGDNYTLTVRASVSIAENSPITLSYSYTLQDTIRRREHLLENKYFECFCKRCSDPTEFKTYLSALICPKCSTGLVLPVDSFNMESTWCCNNQSRSENDTNCPGYSIPARSMQLLIQRISHEYDAIESNDIVSMETFLHKYRNVLHSNHFICLSIKLSLSQLYGNVNGYLMYQLTEEHLLRKVRICREILKIFDSIEPGLTKLRGVTLYEIYAPLMVLLARRYGRCSLTKDETKHQINDIVQCLQEANIILGFEPEGSTEWIMGKAAKQAIRRIQDWKKVIQKS